MIFLRDDVLWHDGANEKDINSIEALKSKTIFIIQF